MLMRRSTLLWFHISWHATSCLCVRSFQGRDSVSVYLPPPLPHDNSPVCQCSVVLQCSTGAPSSRLTLPYRSNALRKYST
ncbi:hypothetical protein V8E55_012106 [Tylopilus felleus]